MKQISQEAYAEGVKSIYVEQPVYELGHDGSDGRCDCIGMCRGGLIREGVTGIKNMSGTNMAARKAIQNLQMIQASAQLLVGDVVLKTRDKDDKSMPLPDKYRKGGSEYSEKWGETNFTHIGTVTRINPLEITHMTSPSAKIDKSIKNWKYFGELPWVRYGDVPEPEPEPDLLSDFDMAVVVAENGSTVKMRAKPTQDCRMYWDVPIGAEVIVDEWDAKVDRKGNTWSLITWESRVGFMMKQYLLDEPEDLGETWTVTIPGLTKKQANRICAEWSEASMKRG